MPPPDDSGVSLGELSRRLTDVFARLEGMARRLEDGQYVRSDLFQQYRQAHELTLSAIQKVLDSLEKDKLEKDALIPLQDRVSQLEDDKKWLVRLVISFVVLAVLGVVIATGGGTP